MSVIMEDVEDSDYCEIVDSGDDDADQCSDISGISGEDSGDANNQDIGASSRSAALDELKIITSEDITKLQASGRCVF